ncbi:O-antigen ligase domain-containing protein, partial [Francisella tularensis subsp. holarctica]|nr:O-antigen ligase domain-containing protein [Francisella tularensis subsp. holarctica]
YKLGSFIALILAWFILINHGFRTKFAEYIIILPLLYIFARRYFKISFVVLVLALVCAGLLELFYNYVIAVVDHSNVKSS